jgi:hypothetical protein
MYAPYMPMHLRPLASIQHTFFNTTAAHSLPKMCVPKYPSPMQQPHAAPFLLWLHVPPPRPPTPPLAYPPPQPPPALDLAATGPPPPTPIATHLQCASVAEAEHPGLGPSKGSAVHQRQVVRGGGLALPTRQEHDAGHSRGHGAAQHAQRGCCHVCWWRWWCAAAWRDHVGLEQHALQQHTWGSMHAVTTTTCFNYCS